MARRWKRSKRALGRAAGAAGSAVLAFVPRSLRERAAPAARYIDMLVLDHLFIRTVFPNRHRLSSEAWRAAQPLPRHIADLARRGVRTVVNLRGELPNATYALEKEACRKAGITLVDFRVKSRDAPTRAELLAARDLFGKVEYPIVMHCKSGADRVGLMSALYLIVRKGASVADAKRQLALRYGHIRQADTGVLDHFFEQYLAETQNTKMAFFDWVETCYDSTQVRQSFRSQRWANRLIDSVLNRE